MANNLRLFPGVTPLNHDPDVMLELAKNAKLDEVVILGFDKDGEFFFSSNKSDGGGVLWLLEMARHELMKLTGSCNRD
jgi:hypothetical protein